jgi:hypothetical protein
MYQLHQGLLSFFMPRLIRWVGKKLQNLKEKTSIETKLNNGNYGNEVRNLRMKDC